MEQFLNGFLVGAGVMLLGTAGPMVMAWRRGQATARYRQLLRDCRADRDVLRQQLKIVRAERNYWISKAKAFLMPEVES